MNRRPDRQPNGTSYPPARTWTVEYCSFNGKSTPFKVTARTSEEVRRYIIRLGKDPQRYAWW